MDSNNGSGNDMDRDTCTLNSNRIRGKCFNVKRWETLFYKVC